MAYMKGSFCSYQYRRGKHFANRNIHIGHAVLKIRFPVRILQDMKHHLHVGTVSVHSLYHHIFAPIKHINDLLLDPLI